MSFIFCEKCQPITCRDAICPYGRVLRILPSVCLKENCRLINPNSHGDQCHAVDCCFGDAVRNFRAVVNKHN